MRTQTVLLAPLLVVLYGCQPETPVQQTPAAEPSVSAAPVVMVPASAPAPVVESALVAESAPVVAEKPTVTVATKPAAVPAPASVVSLAPAKVVEPAAAKAEVTVALSMADGLALAKKNNCLACHDLDRKVVGPAWRDVAAKYRGDGGAEERLANVIAKGGRGAWGSMAMPASPNVSTADRQALARFVLSLK
ncbi:MAG: c-type cytochrome [Gallionella sp.]|nr:c-type cytochrome [Gallionella sp.]